MTASSAVADVLADHGHDDVDSSTLAYLAAAATGPDPVDGVARLLDAHGFTTEGPGRAVAHQIVSAVRRSAQ